jgi:hypothetical protein
MGEGENGWNEWSRHVLAELKRLDDNQNQMNKNLADMQTDIKVLFVRISITATIAGIIGGLIPVLIVVASKFF